MKTELDHAVTAEAVRTAIVLAEDAHVLHYLSRTKIPHLKGILDAEREELQQMVRERFAVLNALAVGKPQTRWGNGPTRISPIDANSKKITGPALIRDRSRQFA